MNINVRSGNCDSADKVLQDFISNINYETAHHRIKTQDIKCGFGLQGVCCRLCANGPCRITPNSPKGVCGATPDQMVARNFIRSVAAGSASYIHVLENSLWALKSLGEKQLDIKGIQTLNNLASSLGIEENDTHKKAIILADFLLDDLYKPSFKKMEAINILGYTPRLNNWKALDIMPGGAKSEVFDALVKSSTNLNTDPTNMLLHSLSLGISTGFYGLTLTNLINDIIMGEPRLKISSVGMKTIDPDYINIMVTGHQHALHKGLEDIINSESVKTLSDQLNVKGIRIVGSTCVGQDMQLRAKDLDGVFSGQAGNNFTTEAILATGAIDLVVSEFNCTLPGIEPIAKDLNIKLIATDELAKKESADLLAVTPENAETVAKALVKEAITSYTLRRNKVKINIPENHGSDNALTGVSEGTLKEFLGGNYQPLINLIASGQIKGIVGIVGCSNLVSGGHDVFTVELAKKLIAKDILVLSAGCTSGGLSNVGLTSLEASQLAGPNLRKICEELNIPPVLNFGPCLAIGRLELVAVELAKALDVDLPQLPLIISAPQWLEEQAIADGMYALSLGLPLHVAKPLFITGGPAVTKLVTEDLLNITGGHLIMNEDVDTTVSTFDEIIMAKRYSLGI